MFRSWPSTASSVMTVVPPSTPMPPHVPIRMKIGSLQRAWYISLIISCKRMPSDGTPIPWLMDKTGPTCDDDVVYIFKFNLFVLFFMTTYLVHWISIGKCADILELSAGRQFVSDFAHNVVGEIFHSFRGATHANKLYRRVERADNYCFNSRQERFWCGFVYRRKQTVEPKNV